MFLTYILMLFIGYAIGRIGHIYGGNFNGPHHWLFGLFLFLPGVFLNSFAGYLIFFFGFGVFIGDLKDFINFKVWGRDNVGTLNFWGID